MDLNLAKCLIEGKHNVFAAYRDGELVYCSNERGVIPALEFLALGPDKTRGASVADRVIGKGSSMIISLTDCKHVYGGLISRGAREYLGRRDIPASWGREVEAVINRNGDDLCPVEKLLTGVEDPVKGVELIRDFLEKMGGSR